MAKAELKTKVSNASVKKFLDSVENETKRKDSFTLLELLQKASGEPPKMWGSSIVGFGSYHYKYESGREGDMPIAGFSPRKQNLTLYINWGGWEQYDVLLSKLGKHSLGKACLYIKKLDDVDMPTLQKLINEAVKYSQKMARQASK
jgi:hypothetical protein